MEVDIDKIYEKINKAKCFDEIKEILTSEELMFLMIHELKLKQELSNGDECLIYEILKLLGNKDLSTRHTIHLLESAKKVVQSISRFNF